MAGFFDGVRDRVQPARSGRFEYTVQGDVLISRSFVRGAGRLRDLRPANHAIHDLLLEEFRRNFDSEGQYASGGWAALAPSTVEQKQRLGLDNGILKRSEAFYRSMTEKGDPNQRVVIGRRKFEMDTKLDYAGFHQTGTSRMPARPQNLNEAARKSVMGIYQRHAMGVL